MTNDRFTIIITLGAAVIGAAGALAGSMISPIITNRSEKRKAKSAIKPELIEAIYLFFVYRRAVMKLINVDNVRVRKINLAWDVISSKDATADQKLFKEKEFQHLLTDRSGEMPLLLSCEEKLTEAEARIHRLLCDIKEHHGMLKYDRIFEIIKPHLDESNQPNALFNIDTASEKKLNRMEDRISESINTKYGQLTEQCDQVISKIQKAL